jgi:hypothetical protein
MQPVSVARECDPGCFNAQFFGHSDRLVLVLAACAGGCACKILQIDVMPADDKGQLLEKFFKRWNRPRLAGLGACRAGTRAT